MRSNAIIPHISFYFPLILQGQKSTTNLCAKYRQNLDFFKGPKIPKKLKIIFFNFLLKNV